MKETLGIFYDQVSIGELSYDRNKDQLGLSYDTEWSSSDRYFPISISLPSGLELYDDAKVRAFISGLLPDSESIRKSWGKRFNVSHRNPFDLIKHVGEDCAGAFQFLSDDRVERILSGKEDRLMPLSKKGLVSRLESLKKAEQAIPDYDDEGRFSLAGAQAKIALHRKAGNWFEPRGMVPTTHIVKPELEEFEEHGLNEHFCLTLARESGIPTAESELEVIGDFKVIVVRRYDRRERDGRILRVHQEDFCQGLGVFPESKYENEGGPSAAQIIGILRDYSQAALTDIENFLRALALNWAIEGTDAHGKNYSLLHGEGGSARLAPLYDLASYLPYQKDPKSRKIKMAMKYGSTYLVHKIGRSHWEGLASSADLKKEDVLRVVGEYLERVRDEALPKTVKRIGDGVEDGFLPLLAGMIEGRLESCLEMLR